MKLVVQYSTNWLHTIKNWEFNRACFAGSTMRACLASVTQATSAKTAAVRAMPWDIMREPKLSLKQRGQRSGQSTRLEDRLRMLCCLEVIDLFGSSGRTRTYNPSVNSRMLYH